MATASPITVEVSVKASLDQAWRSFTSPTEIVSWNFAIAEWHCPRADSDLREGGAFCYRMEARDGSFGFDFAGTFLEVSPPTLLRYSLGEHREVIVRFTQEGDHTRVSQSFTPETTHSLEQQRTGWQSILENYKKHVEGTKIGC